MAASDHLGEHILRVYHSSRGDTPPHIMRKTYAEKEREHAQWAWDNDLAYTNVHPDIVHAGTREAAEEVSAGTRPYMHVYDIDTREMSPVTYGDAPKMDDDKRYTSRMVGKQPSLWESIPSTGEETLKHGRVQPYRNKVEDRGSISYMIPKSEVGTSRVKYVGEINKGNAQ